MQGTDARLNREGLLLLRLRNGKPQRRGTLRDQSAAIGDLFR